MSDLDPATPSPTPAKRPRPVISCFECRRKKLKCSRTYPCQQCIKIGRPGRCEYQAGQEPEPNTEYTVSSDRPNKRQRVSALFENIGREESSEQPQLRGQEQVSASHGTHGIIEDLQARMARLENAVFPQTSHPASNSISRHGSPEQLPARDGARKSHVRGTLSEISSQFDDACTFMSRLDQDSLDQDLLALRTDLRSLHYSVETNNRNRHAEKTPIPSTMNSPVQLPPFAICEKLAVLYFDNMEHCFRVLHWPEFRDQLSTLFEEGEDACSFGFIPQLVGVLTVAVLLATHPECATAAACSVIQPTQAIHFMENFLSSLRRSERYRLPTLQIKMLLSICKWLNMDAFDDLFRHSGELLRDALVMRMDRDPSSLKGISVYEGEIRRRSWMTVVELELMLSILCNMPCTVPPYSSEPPRNVNDQDLYRNMKTLPLSQSTDHWTDSLCQYLLAQSFPHRVAACSQLDRSGGVTAEAILPHIRHLERMLQELPPPLRFNYLGDKASKTPARLMARMELDISIRRPLMHLYLGGVLSQDMKTARRELQAGFLQSCLMISNYQDLFDPQYSELDVPRPQGYWDFFYNCYRQELGQATLGLCLEIKHHSPTAHADGTTPTTSATSPNTSKGPSYTKENLVTAMKDSFEPMCRRLPHRAAKVKDLVFYEIILASLAPKNPEHTRDAFIIHRLQSLVRECRDELGRAGVEYLTAPAPESHPTASQRDLGKTSTITTFDPLWEGFPIVEIFESVEF